MNIERDVSLEEYNTFKIPVKAKYLVRIQKEQDIYDLMQNDLWNKEKHYILNWWANVLFTRDFDWIILKIEMIGKTVLNDLWLIEVYSWENRSDFVEWSCSKWYYWIENLIDIPWNVGTAPVSNIWAYWVEIASFVKYVEWINLKTWKKEIFCNEDCEFSYRTSLFKHGLKENFLITKVDFCLPKVTEWYKPNITYHDVKSKIEDLWIIVNTPIEVLNIVRDIRASKLPDWHKIGTAGSFFANPIITQQEWSLLVQKFENLSHHDCIVWLETKVKLSWGQLIDLCWLKWWRTKNGKAWTYEKHALILVNEWWTAEDVLDAMSTIQKMVFEKFGVHLDPEVVLV